MDGGRYTIQYENGEKESMNSLEYVNAYHLAKDDDRREAAYVAHLRGLLVTRLKDEEECERLEMYCQDRRFEIDGERSIRELHRILIDMLHCLMRMHEKVLFLLYFAAMQRFTGDTPERTEVLERMSARIRIIGNLPET